MLLPILTYPNPLLRGKCQPVENPNDSAIKKLAANMIETMRAKDGVGLAANQVGQLLQIIVVATDKEPLVLFNPKILRYSWRKIISEEGCLSLPKTILKIRRSRTVKVQAATPQGEKIQFTARGMLAIVIQHEVDHLNGILIIDKNAK
jgi:peptide deformylase